MDMTYLNLFQPFFIALVLGAVLGFERTYASRVSSDFLGGIRTYSLVSLLGSLSSFLSEKFFPEILIVAFLGIVAMTVVSYYISFGKHNEGGITTEVSMLICFIIGVIVQKNLLVLALFISIMTAAVLHLKEYLHRMSDRMEKDDIQATLKFAVITFIIIMFDPDYTFYIKDVGFPVGLFERFPGLADVKMINPYTVWLMVVLVSGIGFSGYIAIKFMGARKGIGLTGLLGGIVSSTATTMTISRRSKDDNAGHLSYALAVILACSTMFPRILLEVLVINAELLRGLGMVMGMMAFAGFLFCLVIWKKSGKEKGEEIEHKNPFNILPAFKFGLIFAVIVLIARISEVIAGDSGVYIISVLTGLSDVDPITLTMSQISRDDPSKLNQATIAITLAAFSNTAMKAGLACFLGSKRFRLTVLLGFGVILFAGVFGLAIAYLI
ncbi:MAG TPA: MgtC/SapB family protein [Spirochaetota bacterium]|nr:MgtC/SapB family protein [Spirochaetota bacterium]HOD13264.1 MgtC/SapB family protein [Spirochaetota bacterium]HPG51250.1 MgtC/SapB family protein [Spirochaetota bacterium]HPN10838.1 MgtC/SapB family protein [Spirochaetota bacterium]